MHITFNYVRPHQSSGYLTPDEFYHRWLKEHKPSRH
jgi:transposase InsO family protein